MNNYLQLIPISGKIHKKQSRITRVCIVLAVFLVTAIFGMADMEMKSQLVKAKREDGFWHAMFRNVTDEQAIIIKNWNTVEASSFYCVANYRLSEDYIVNEKKVCICGMEKDFEKIYEDSKVISGTFPVKKDEIIITEKTQKELQVSVGDTLTLKRPNASECTLTVSGITKDTGMLLESDVYGIFTSMEGFKYLTGKTDQEEIARAYYVQFKDHLYIPKELEKLESTLNIPKESVSENTKILGILGQSDDSYMLELYGTAMILTVLVITAGVLMITSNLNSNVARRTEFFGMLRCLGATKKQVIRFVKLEALNWCKTAVPIGITTGTGIVILLCAMLRMLSPIYFADMPVFGISWIGIVLGALIGVITVLLAAAPPARRAARVSPLTAVTGNYEISKYKVSKVKLHGMKVDTVLGKQHAMGSRKNFILMVLSFAFSIILFLAFSTVVDFMHYAIKPLRPYAPDLSIYYEDQHPGVDKELVDRIAQIGNVKKVYGRKFAYQVPITVNGRETVINLISYEQNQFGFAKNNLLDGNIESVENEDGVFAVFSPNTMMKMGDVLRFSQNKETVSCNVTGVLKDSPFDEGDGTENIIVSEKTFNKIIGDTDYTIIDIQVKNSITEDEVNYIHELAGEGTVFSDRRMSNKDVKGAYYSFAIFVYGFLTIIALISFFNILNSIDMSVTARIQQYGAMRAIGMSNMQVLKMITGEAVTYGVFGILTGCLIGIPVNKILFESLVTFRWGTTWYVPTGALLFIAAVLIIAICIAVYKPYRQISEMSIADTISYS